MRVREADRRTAELLGRDAERTAAPALRAVRPTTIRALRAAYAALRRGESPALAVRREFMAAAPVLAELMLAGHLRGRVRAFARIEGRTPRTAARVAFATASPYREAIATLERRLNLSDAEVARLAEKYGREAVTATGKIAGPIERAVQEAVLRAVTEGLHVREGQRLIREAMARAGAAPANPYLFETVYRTQARLAYSAGRFSANQDRAIQDILWGYTYVTVGDDRVRPSHELLDGTTAPKDDPIWDRIMPPNGYGCRCEVLERFNDEDDLRPEYPPGGEVMVDGHAHRAGPDAGFDFNPGLVFG